MGPSVTGACVIHSKNGGKCKIAMIVTRNIATGRQCVVRLRRGLKKKPSNKARMPKERNISPACITSASTSVNPNLRAYKEPTMNVRLPNKKIGEFGLMNTI